MDPADRELVGWQLLQKLSRSEGTEATQRGAVRALDGTPVGADPARASGPGPSAGRT